MSFKILAGYIQSQILYIRIRKTGRAIFLKFHLKTEIIIWEHFQKLNRQPYLLYSNTIFEEYIHYQLYRPILNTNITTN